MFVVGDPYGEKAGTWFRKVDMMMVYPLSAETAREIWRKGMNRKVRGIGRVTGSPFSDAGGVNWKAFLASGI